MCSKTEVKSANQSNFIPLLCFHQSPGDGFYIAVGGGIGQHGWCHIQSILQDKQYDVKFEDHSEKMGMLSIQGPKR